MSQNKLTRDQIIAKFFRRARLERRIYFAGDDSSDEDDRDYGEREGSNGDGKSPPPPSPPAPPSPVASDEESGSEKESAHSTPPMSVIKAPPPAPIIVKSKPRRNTRQDLDDFLTEAFEAKKSAPVITGSLDAPTTPPEITTTTTTTTTTVPAPSFKPKTQTSAATLVPIEVEGTPDDPFAMKHPLMQTVSFERIAETQTEARRTEVVSSVLTAGIEKGEVDYPWLTGFAAIHNMQGKTRHHPLTRAEVEYNSRTSQFTIGEANISKSDLAAGKIQVQKDSNTITIAEKASPLTLALMFVPREKMLEINTGGGQNVFKELERIKKRHDSEDDLIDKIDEAKRDVEKSSGSKKLMAEKVLGKLRADLKLLHDPAVSAAIIQYGIILGLSGILDKKVSGKPPVKFELVKPYQAKIAKEIAAKKAEIERLRKVIKGAEGSGYESTIDLFKKSGVEVDALEKVLEQLKNM